MFRFCSGRMAARAVLAASFAVGLTACKEPMPDVLKIGVVTTLSGQYVARGKDILDGAQLAADEINASHLRIGGKPVRVEITSADDKGDAEKARQGAEQLMNDGAHAIIGPILAPSTIAVVKAVAERGLPHMFTTTPTALTGMGRGNTFRLLAHDDLQGRAMGMFAHDTLQGQRIAFVTEAGDYGRGLLKTVREALQGVKTKAVYEVEVDAKGDVTPEIAEKIKAAQCDVIVLMARDPQLLSLLNSLKAVNYTDVSIVGSNTVRNKATAKFPSSVRGVYATATAIDPEEFPLGRQFVSAFNAKFKADPVWGAHYAYDGVYALVDAARRARSVKPQDLIAKLKSIEPMTPVNQQMRFSAQGEQMYASIGIYKLERGAWISQMRSSIW